jgi:uridine kinase
MIKTAILYHSIVKSILDFPFIIAIDGITGSGKSSFATNLKAFLNNEGIESFVVHLDNFHNNKQIRYQEGRNSPRGYFNHAFNIDGIMKNLLHPFKNESKFKEKIHDLETDQELNSPWITIKEKSVLIVEGSFSLREELNQYYDLKIYLNVTKEQSLRRLLKRDQKLFSSPEELESTTRNRYQAAHDLHLLKNSPIKIADFVVDNNDFNNPSIKT